jgi:hypothetical protein
MQPWQAHWLFAVKGLLPFNRKDSVSFMVKVTMVADRDIKTNNIATAHWRTLERRHTERTRMIA